MTGPRIGQRNTLVAGPWKGVRDTTDPFDDSPDFLVDALNLYIPDPAGASGAYARPGFQLLNAGSPIFTSASDFRGEGIYTHQALDGNSYNFYACGGRLFRSDLAMAVFTDVTPVGITIDAGISTRVQFASLGDQLAIADSVNRPWLATNLNATPITGTYIDYDGAAVAWTTQHIVVWGGGLVVILKSVNGIFRQDDIAWSEPGDMATGYQQPNFDNNWTIEQTGTAPLQALGATNLALFYFRARSIGAISGILGPDLATTSTHDAIAFNVGTQAPQSIQQYGNSIFFCDAIGRPWMLQLGSPPQPIWLNMRAVVDASATAYPAITAITCTSAFEPTLNLYVCAIWSPTPSAQAPPAELYVFDGNTGTYVGRWAIAPGIAIDCLGSWYDSHGRSVFLVSGSKLAAPATGGYLWSFNSLNSVPDGLETEGDVLLLTEDSRNLTTEGQDALWQDNGASPLRLAMTQRLGYNADVIWNVDRCVIISDTPGPIQVTMQTTTTAGTVEGTPVPSASNDGTYRLVCGANAIGRGTQVTVMPTTSDAQWTLERVQLTAVPSQARPEDG